MKKNNIVLKILNKKTGFFYIKYKNNKNTKQKIMLKKYDPKLRRHVFFKEK